MSNTMIFDTITKFVNEMEDMFGAEQRSLKLYAHLLRKTDPTMEVSIQKHVDAFRIFCIENREAISKKDMSKAVASKIIYSKKVFIDFEHVFSLADDDSADSLWDYILLFSAHLDPSGNAKEMLKQSTMNRHNNMNIDENNPVGSMMKSPLFSGIMNKMQSGELDVGKLIGSMQGLLANIEDGGDNPDILGDLMGMINQSNE